MKIYVRYFLIVLCLCVATSVHAEEICEIDRYNIIERVESRHYPSLLSQFGIGPWETTFSEAENRELYDLIFYNPGILLSYWRDTLDGMKLIADPGLESSKRRRERLLASNPNLVFLAVVTFYLVPDNYKEREAFNSIRDDFFLRDENGEIVRDEIWNSVLLDFTLPQTQQYIKDQVMAISQCGLFDGIFLDNWSEHPRLYGYRTLEEEHIARDKILQSIREIDEDFLILVNSGPHKIPRWAPYINGIWMEAGAGANSIYDSHELDQIQETLLWAETEAPFREPLINALTADGNPGIPPDSSETLQVVRSLTTLVLTHSNAYMAFKNGGGFSAAFWGKDVTYEGVHAVWLDFWSAPLGRPMGGDETKGQPYVTPKGVAIEGLFIREFTNGWAVYNRSGKERKIYLPEKVSGVASGVKNKHWHTIPDLDGEIFLKKVTPPINEIKKTTAPADVNNDGKVNIDDIRLVIAAIGVEPTTTTRADVNEDGTVNVVDLQIVIDDLDNPTTAEAPTFRDDVSGTFNAALLRAELQRFGTDTQQFTEAIALLKRLLASTLPEQTLLLANYPNPFNPETWIPYQLATDTDVGIHIYDTRGSLVRSLELGHQRAGIYTGRGRAAYWDGRNNVGERVASGIYFYQLQADGLSSLRKMVILK